MSEEQEQQVSGSGGTMRRLRDLPPRPDEVDLEALEVLRGPWGYAGPARAAGGPPHLGEGEVVTWHYRLGVDVLRVVRDDERGLVAWLPTGSERVAARPRDGLGLRDRSLAERARLAVERGYDHVLGHWAGPGILRIAPTGAPWSLWYFWDGDAFEGHYVNLELPHRRPADGSPQVHSRDLTLDLWLDADGALWLKDEDELAAFTDVGIFTPDQADAVRRLGDLAHRDLVAPRAWPLDEGWESWRPPPGWDEPLALPDGLR